jgi:O-methyltransferase
MLGLEYQKFLAQKWLFKKSFHLAHKIFPEGGTSLEFGVFRGNSYVYQAQEIAKKYTHDKLMGFDSWQGLPDEANSVWRPSFHAKGEYSSTKDIVIHKLDIVGLKDDKRLSFVDGFYSDSLTEELRSKINDVIFVNIDVDIYQSTIELLDFIGPLLRPGVVLYWDDWKDPRVSYKESWGEHLAWEEWSSKHQDIKAEFLEQNWINQRIMIVTEANGKTLENIGFSMEKIRTISSQQDSTYAKLTKAVVHNPPVSNMINFGFQLWGRMKSL